MNIRKYRLLSIFTKIVCISSIMITATCSANNQLASNDIALHQDITFAKFGDRKIILDLYQPKLKGTYPGIILVHGGGWIQGTRKGFSAMAKELAQKGYVVANIDYRLSKEAKFPAAVQDTKAAVRWLRANAEEYQVDADNIAGIGASAGGHLIAMAALTGHSNQFNGEGNNPEISGELKAYIILGSGVDQVTRVKLAPNMYVKNSAIFFGDKYIDNPDIYALGSPINHITTHAPPVLILDGEKDRPGERYVGFIEKLNKLNIEYEFQVIKGAKHADWSKEPYRSQYIEAYNTFLKKHLN